jgi:hypothetical protein
VILDRVPVPSTARALWFFRSDFLEGGLCGCAGELANDLGGGTFNEFRGDRHGVLGEKPSRFLIVSLLASSCFCIR